MSRPADYDREKLPPKTVIVAFRPPALVWSENESMHWAAKAALRRTWRQAAAVYTLNVCRRNKIPQPLPTMAHVQVTLPFVTKQKRDAHNYTGTVVKSIVDGLRDAHLLVDDDTEHVTVADPILDVGGRVVEVRVTWE